MIEVIYKDEKQEVNDGETGWNLPKNIRQIGLAGENYRIYIEDYVYTFLHRAAQAKCQQEEDSGILAVFLGENRWQSGTGYTFIRGALLADAGEITEEHIEITQNMWQKIHEEQEKYFEGQEIVGWFLARQSLPMVVSELIGKVHRNQFGGEKILMLMDTAEQEEAFFRYENNFLVRQSGYYIYYEKNTQMQNYMLEKNPEIQEESQETVQDDAVRAFRSLIQKKKKEEPEETEEKTSVFSYAATACIVLALAVVGVRFYRNYQVGQNIEGETRTASADIMQETEITQIPAASFQLLRSAQKRRRSTRKNLIPGKHSGGSSRRSRIKKRAQDRITQVRPVQIRTARQHLQCRHGALIRSVREILCTRSASKIMEPWTKLLTSAAQTVFLRTRSFIRDK